MILLSQKPVHVQGRQGSALEPSAKSPKSPRWDVVKFHRCGLLNVPELGIETPQIFVDRIDPEIIAFFEQTVLALPPPPPPPPRREVLRILLRDNQTVQTRIAIFATR